MLGCDPLPYVNLAKDQEWLFGKSQMVATPANLNKAEAVFACMPCCQMQNHSTTGLALCACKGAREQPPAAVLLVSLSEELYCCGV